MEVGISLVEFAIILPIFLVIIFGIIEFGIILYNNAMVTNASRVGARAGVVYVYDDNDTPTNLDDDKRYLSNDNIITTVNNYCSNALVSFSTSSSPNTQICFSYITDPDNFICDDENSRMQAPSGSLLKVKVDYTYNSLLLSALLPDDVIDPLNLTAETIMRME